MNEGMISKRYAKALLLFAKDGKSEDKVYSEMKMLAAVFGQEPKLRMALDNPMLNIEDKQNLINACVGKKPSAEFLKFVGLVLKNKREKYLRNIALSYIDLYAEEKHINMGKLVTATPVDDSVKDKMKGLLQQIKPKGTLDFETSVDPDIEGGFVLYIDDYRLDASVKTQLQRIKQQFVVENSKMN
ncbi:MAG: F0F1 ATP synthase subunit delta [Prevotella sp.]|jgi:F-type H+-transporting ATPase subunit delta|nr:F0F1 ATP synthase subunit delta [Prevotella sp.]